MKLITQLFQLTVPEGKRKGNMTNERKELDILFPYRSIKVGDGEIRVRPISLEDLPKALDSLFQLAKIALDAKDTGDQIGVAIKGAKYLLDLIPYCTDISPKSIPAPLVPDLIEAIIDLNYTEEAVGKLKSLFARVSPKLGKAADQGQTSTEPLPKE